MGGPFTVEELPDPDRPLDLIGHNIDNASPANRARRVVGRSIANDKTRRRAN